MARIERTPCVLGRRARVGVALILLVAGGALLLGASAEAQEPRPSAKPRATKPQPVADIKAAPAAADARLNPVPVSVTATPAVELEPPVFELVDPAKAYFLGAGDVVRVTVFQQPDMTVEGRVSEVGTLTIPLIGPVEVAGLTARQAETRIGYLLKRGGFVRDPQVNVNVLQFKSRQVSILGYVSRPGRYSMEEGIYRITDVLSLAGGAVAAAGDVVTLVRERNGRVERYEIDIPGLFNGTDFAANLQVLGGDTVYVDRAPQFYIYGEVQRPGGFRLEKGMTLMQGLSLAGGLTLRGSKKDIQVTRKQPQGNIVTFTIQPGDTLHPEDVVFVRESLF